MMDDGEVSKALKFMVAEVVSNAAGCMYCTAHNAQNALHIGGVAPEKVEALWQFQTSPLFTMAERAALDLALAAGGHIRLVETLADRIAELALDDARARRAEVTVDKLDVFADAQSAGVTVVRRRATRAQEPG
jgi:hypothetical protein